MLFSTSRASMRTSTWRLHAFNLIVPSGRQIRPQAEVVSRWYPPWMNRTSWSFDRRRRSCETVSTGICKRDTSRFVARRRLTREQVRWTTSESALPLNSSSQAKYLHPTRERAPLHTTSYRARAAYKIRQAMYLATNFGPFSLASKCCDMAYGYSCVNYCRSVYC